MTESSSPSFIIKDTRSMFALEQNGAGFNVNRGLWYDNESGAQGYIDHLPTFSNLNIVQLVDREIEKRKIEQNAKAKPYSKVKVVDIGYGRGKFLMDSSKKWGDKIELTGYGNDYFAKNSSTGNKGQLLPPLFPELKSSGVELIYGDVIDIRKLLGDNNVDFLVCSNVMQWIRYPRWEMIKKLYRVLKPSGIALLDPMILEVRNGSLSGLQNYLKSQGYDFEITDETVAFRKTEPDITLPIRTIEDLKVVSYPAGI